MLKTDNIDSVNQKRLQIKIYNLNVLEAGIEPALPKELDFESSASTSSATRAYFFPSGS